MLPPSGEVPKAIGACQRPSNNVGYAVVLPPQPSGQLPRWGANNDLPLNIIALPAWGRETASAALGFFRKHHKCASLSLVLPSLFHTMSALSAPPVSSSRVQPRDLYCTAAIGTHASSLKRYLGASFFDFPSLTVYRSARKIPPLRSG